MKKYFVANWKMNMLSSQAREFVDKIRGIETENYVAIAPPFTLLGVLKEARQKSSFKIGAQNVSSFQKGAFTGEVSAEMLSDFGLDFVIIGHSERRHIFNESNDDIHKKVLLSVANDLDVILCVGETLEQRDSGFTNDVIHEQITSALHDVTLKRENQLIIAYEPVWAIGTGSVAQTFQIKQVHELIDTLIKKLGYTPIILYGGSVNRENYQELQQIESVDGFLIGGASLDVNSFMQIAGEKSSLL